MPKSKSSLSRRHNDSDDPTMDSRGRGTSRGRARVGRGQFQPGATPGQAPVPQPGPSGARPGAPNPWGPRPQAPSGPDAFIRPTGPPQMFSGRSQAGGDQPGVPCTPDVLMPEGDTGNRGGAGVRGRMNRNEIIRTRPSHIESKTGTEGTPILLRANYFPLISAKQWGLNEYSVDFNPPIDDTRLKKKLVGTGLRGQFADKISGYLFDGSVLFTPSRFPVEPLEFTVADDQAVNYIVHMRLVGELNAGEWQYLQVFNIMVRKCLTFMDFKLLGRNHYDPTMKVVLREHNLEVWPGFMTSMSQYERNIMLNVDLSFKVLRLDRVYDLLIECGSNRDPRHEFQQRLIGQIVLTPYNNKTYRIDDVDFNGNPNSTFARRDGSHISYKSYFEEKYRVRVQQADQPLLISRSKPREIRAGMPEIVVLLPELCIMTGLTDRQRENFHLMKALGEHTRVAAGVRVQKLQRFAQRLTACPEAIAEVRKWDLKLAEDLVELTGRIIPMETIFMGNDRQVTGGEEADWTRHFRSNSMYSTIDIDRLAIIAPHRIAGAAQEFSRTLTKVAQSMGMTICGKVMAIADDRPATYLAELERVISSMQPRMVMVCLPNNSGDRYSAIKKKCYVDRAIPCQVMVARNLNSKGVMSIATKVAIQLNCKMGGAAWGVSMPASLMVVGYDVCRDTANKGKSFAGMVASMDGSCTKYYSMTTEHENEQELSKNIASFMLIACTKYQEMNRSIPQRIIIYRDGVGDGQIPYVKDQEVNLIKEKLQAEMYKSVPLRMAFIIVSKRINTKLFRSRPNQRNDFNPPPGTVVDDVITWPSRYDFYLVSQCVRQGTVAPTSYNVIEESLGIDCNKLQRFTYKMTHMYYNFSGTVRVPAPCQYAHKLAFLTAQSLHRSANAALNSTLYYL